MHVLKTHNIITYSLFIWKTLDNSKLKTAFYLFNGQITDEPIFFIPNLNAIHD